MGTWAVQCFLEHSGVELKSYLEVPCTHKMKCCSISILSFRKHFCQQSLFARSQFRILSGVSEN